MSFVQLEDGVLTAVSLCPSKMKEVVSSLVLDAGELVEVSLVKPTECEVSIMSHPELSFSFPFPLVSVVVFNSQVDRTTCARGEIHSCWPMSTSCGCGEGLVDFGTQNFLLVIYYWGIRK